MAKLHRMVLTTRKSFKELSYEEKRNIRGQIHNELDNTGNFQLKSFVSLAAMHSAIIVISFKKKKTAKEFRQRLMGGMHPDRYETFKLVYRCSKISPKRGKVIMLKHKRAS